MIGLANSISDTDGAIILEAEVPAPQATVTRATRSKTLDSGAVIVNSGCDYGDDTYRFPVQVTEAEYELIDGLQRNNARLIIATKNGLFSGIIKSKSLNGTTLTITLWIEEEI